MMVGRSDKSKAASPKTNPQAVVSSIAPTMQSAHGVPVNKLGDDLVRAAEALAVADHTVGPVDLGVYVAEEDQSLRAVAPMPMRDGQPLGGVSATIAFDEGYHRFFMAYLPSMRAVTLAMGRLFSGEAGARRYAALVDVLDERVEQAASRKRWRRWRHSSWLILVAGFAFARYFAEQAEWIIEKLPVFKQIWILIVGGKG